MSGITEAIKDKLRFANREAHRGMQGHEEGSAQTQGGAAHDTGNADNANRRSESQETPQKEGRQPFPLHFLTVTSQRLRSFVDLPLLTTRLNPRKFIDSVF